MQAKIEKSKKSISGFNLKLKSYILYLMLKFLTNFNISMTHALSINFPNRYIFYAPNSYFISTPVTVSRNSEDRVSS